MLEEVVVVGFGTQKRINLTGSVGIATAKELESRPVSSATQALQGLVPDLKLPQVPELWTKIWIFPCVVPELLVASSGSPLLLIDGMERGY